MTSDVNSSLVGWHKMSSSQECIICFLILGVYEIGIRMPFLSNNIGISQTICICLLPVTKLFSAQLPSYCLQCVVILSIPVPPEMQNFQLLYYLARSTGTMDQFFTILTLGQCGGLVRTSVGGHDVMKGLIYNQFCFGKIWSSFKE